MDLNHELLQKFQINHTFVLKADTFRFGSLECLNRRTVQALGKVLVVNIVDVFNTSSWSCLMDTCCQAGLIYNCWPRKIIGPCKPHPLSFLNWATADLAWITTPFFLFIQYKIDAGKLYLVGCRCVNEDDYEVEWGFLMERYTQRGCLQGFCSCLLCENIAAVCFARLWPFIDVGHVGVAKAHGHISVATKSSLGLSHQKWHANLFKGHSICLWVKKKKMVVSQIVM